MNWQDRGFVLGTRRHGESALILEVMTREHGRHLGLVHGGGSRRLRPLLQPGNGVALTWRARLDEQLGTFVAEPTRMRAAAIIGSPSALYGITTLAAHLRLLPERDPHAALFDAADALVGLFGDAPRAGIGLAHFELALLAELGFGLDLATCAATGATRDLVWVSPRTGRAVGREAGEPWRDRLLALPPFLTGDGGPPDAVDLAAAFRLTGHFLDVHLYGPRGAIVPDERARFVARAVRSAAASGNLHDQPADATDSVRDVT